ncbi:hypothetical protein M406DRAFT_354069 [Cryphonectria parasitica EP155]|uniref:Uncharacterized protein n=1 Tax=Cryphonectria parasitica (strain ATCC 38755 / EP155) TaxID=660469 RepID=A0A9P4YA64_CRYP1|nr:uncharacterized protein M406DRAFT_354069 [Cryphonectria parasitica EP155]KAF3769606.1 hypothetical protein M406DRAFT_354069 [Cryphonectria parasitica EP155]
MRVEGMSMATQWSNADINVDIALAAGNDSNQMRSISLVTMVFLPGTFFATFFSMTFFDWSPSESESVVSSYIWIYVAITGACTFLTLLAWGYFVGFRRQKGQQIDSDAMV